MEKPIYDEIIRHLKASDATFNCPSSSDQIGGLLNVTPSYVRLVVQRLVAKGKVCVRRGRGGGYYLR